MSQWPLFLYVGLLWAQSSIQAAEAHTCQMAQIRTSLGPNGAGMGHAYNELILQNMGTRTCRLDVDSMLFQRMDGADQRSGRVRRGNMPTEVHRNIAVNMDGDGSPQVKLAPQHRTAITMDWANRTGYTEADLCATKMRLRLARQPGILLDVSTQACDPRVFVSGFHEVRNEAP